MEKYNLDNNEEGRRKRPRMKRAEGIEFNNQNSSENQHRRFFKKKNGKRLKGSEEIIQNKINRRKSRQAPPEPKYDGTTRLNKYISNAGICSRRDADKLIEAGAVSVNGEVITVMGYRVKEGDVVTYAGQVLRRTRQIPRRKPQLRAESQALGGGSGIRPDGTHNPQRGILLQALRPNPQRQPQQDL